MGYLIHVANVCILASFLVRDILWLRLLSVLGGVAFMAYFGWALDEPLWPPILWNGLFGLVNLVQILRLVAERRPVHLTVRERHLRDLAFPELSDRDLRRLLQVGRFEERSGEDLVRAGETPSHLLLLSKGQADVYVEAAQVAALAPGRFVGEMAYLSGRPASAGVRAAGFLEVFSWEAKRLRAFLDADPVLCASVQRRLGSDLAAKLRAG